MNADDMISARKQRWRENPDEFRNYTNALLSDITGLNKSEPVSYERLADAADVIEVLLDI